MRNDAVEYFHLAENVAAGKGVSLDGSNPNSYRPPLYPALLGAWFFLTRHLTGNSIRFYQCVCMALSVLFSYYLALVAFDNRRTAIVVASIIAIHPSLVTHTAFGLQEPTLLLFTTITVWLTLRWLRSGGERAAIMAGASWGVATLGKVVTVYLPLIPFIFLFFSWKKGSRISFREVIWACAVFVVVLVPWTARNYYHFHRLIPVNDQGFGMLEWNVRHADPPDSGKEGLASNLLDIFRYRSGEKNEPAGDTFVEKLDAEGVRGEARRERMVGYVLDHWRYFLAQRVWNAMYFALPSIDWWIHSGKVSNVRGNVPVLLLMLLHLPFYIFFAGRVWGLLRAGDPGYAISYLVVFFLFYWITYAMLVGEPRFSLPVYPVLISLAPWERFFRPKGTTATDGPAIDPPLS
jgi:4-amino-4-deoxy-L-arabinose transferase-like glycosyltransferase